MTTQRRPFNQATVDLQNATQAAAGFTATMGRSILPILGVAGGLSLLQAGLTGAGSGAQAASAATAGWNQALYQLQNNLALIAAGPLETLTDILTPGLEQVADFTGDNPNASLAIGGGGLLAFLARRRIGRGIARGARALGRAGGVVGVAGRIGRSPVGRFGGRIAGPLGLLLSALTAAQVGAQTFDDDDDDLPTAVNAANAAAAAANAATIDAGFSGGQQTRFGIGGGALTSSARARTQATLAAQYQARQQAQAPNMIVVNQNIAGSVLTEDNLLDIVLDGIARGYGALSGLRP